MSSEQISTIAIDPFIREFTFQIIKTIGLKKYYRRERMIVHSDLVPRFSENVVKASMGQKLIPPRQLPMLRTENVPEEMKILVEPIPEKKYFASGSKNCSSESCSSKNRSTAEVYGSTKTRTD
ncbi:MAG: hypothetical protein ABIF88_03435 [archaeon]